MEEVNLLQEFFRSIGITTGIGAIGSSDDHPSGVFIQGVFSKLLKSEDEVVLEGISIELIQLAVRDTILEGFRVRLYLPS